MPPDDMENAIDFLKYSVRVFVLLNAGIVVVAWIVYRLTFYEEDDR